MQHYTNICSIVRYLTGLQYLAPPCRQTPVYFSQARNYQLNVKDQYTYKKQVSLLQPVALCYYQEPSTDREALRIVLNLRSPLLQFLSKSKRRYKLGMQYACPDCWRQNKKCANHRDTKNRWQYSNFETFKTSASAYFQSVQIRYGHRTSLPSHQLFTIV